MNTITTSQYLAAGLLAVALLCPVPSYAESCPKHQSNGVDKTQLVESPRMQSDFNPSATARPTFEVWASLGALAWLVGWLLYMKPAVAPPRTESNPITPMRTGEMYAASSVDEPVLESTTERRRCSAISSHLCTVPRFGDRGRPRRSSRIGSYTALDVPCSIVSWKQRESRRTRMSLHRQRARGATTCA